MDDSSDECESGDEGGGAEGEQVPQVQEPKSEEGLCQLSGAFMTEPVKTPYGHVASFLITALVVMLFRFLFPMT